MRFLSFIFCCVHFSVLVLPFLHPHVFLAIHILPDSHKSSLYAWLLAEGRDTDKKVNIVKLVMFNVTRARFFTACFVSSVCFCSTSPISQFCCTALHPRSLTAGILGNALLSKQLFTQSQGSRVEILYSKHIYVLLLVIVCVTALKQRDLCLLSLQLSVADPLLQLDELFCLS